MFEYNVRLGYALDYRGSGGYGHARPMRGHVSVVCKRNGDSPYIVANELVAAEIGRVLRLPVPPGFVVRDAAQTPYFASLNFNPAGEPLLPIIPPIFINAFRPHLASIVVFDMFIANTDRHAHNISADYSQPSFKLFDHSIALLGLTPGSGNARLAQMTNAAGIWNHLVIAGIDDEGSLLEAAAKVELVPDYFIESVVSEAGAYGLSPEEVEGLTRFLIDRKSQMRRLIGSNKHLFPGIAEWKVL